MDVFLNVPFYENLPHKMFKELHLHKYMHSNVLQNLFLHPFS